MHLIPRCCLSLGLALTLLACAPPEAAETTAQDVTDVSDPTEGSEATYRIERLPYSTYLTVSLIGDDGERLLESFPGHNLAEANEDVARMDRAGAVPEHFVISLHEGASYELWLTQLFDEFGLPVASGYFDDRSSAEVAAYEAASQMGGGDPHVDDWLSVCGLELLEGDGRYYLRKYISPSSGPTNEDELALRSGEFDSEEEARAVAGSLAALAAEPEAYRFGEDTYGHHYRVVDADGEQRLFSPDFATEALAVSAAAEAQQQLQDQLAGSADCSADEP